MLKWKHLCCMNVLFANDNNSFVKIYLMDELLWILNLGHDWDDLPEIFTSDKVTSKNHWQITSRVTQKSLFTVKNVLYYFLRIICPVLLMCYMYWTHSSAKHSNRSLIRHRRWGRSFLILHCDVAIVDLWLQANLRWWQRDVTFVDCSCMRKIYTKSIFTIEQQLWISISHHPVNTF